MAREQHEGFRRPMQPDSPPRNVDQRPDAVLRCVETDVLRIHLQ